MAGYNWDREVCNVEPSLKYSFELHEKEFKMSEKLKMITPVFILSKI